MKEFLISLKITIAFSVILFVCYVMVLWGIAAIATPNNGQAEVVSVDGKIVGVKNVGQKFSSPKYFWSRPSAVDYNANASGGSNKSVTNTEYINEVSSRIDVFMKAHPYIKRYEVPSEIVTASGSGLDPHISIESAMVQAQRVANYRNIDVDVITQLIENATIKPLVGLPVVNVLELNIMIDKNY